MSLLLNYVLYQIGWFACVLGVAWGYQGLGVCIALSLVGIHIYLATDRFLQLKLCLTAAAVGLTADAGQMWAGVFTFPKGTVVDWLPPPAITVLWLQFGTTLPYCMRWLSQRYAVCACFGLLGAPLAFFAGERLGAVEFMAPRWMHFAMLGLVWAIAVPLLVYVSDSWTRNAETPSYRWL